MFLVWKAEDPPVKEEHLYDVLLFLSTTHGIPGAFHFNLEKNETQFSLV